MRGWLPRGACRVAVGCMLRVVRGAVAFRLHVASCREAGCCIMHIALCSLKALRQHTIAPPPRGGSRKTAAESDAGVFSHPWLPPGPHAACAERRRVLRMLYDRCTGVRCRRMPKPFGGAAQPIKPHDQSEPSENSVAVNSADLPAARRASASTLAASSARAASTRRRGVCTARTAASRRTRTSPAARRAGGVTHGSLPCRELACRAARDASARPAALVTPGKNVPSFNGAIGFVK